MDITELIQQFRNDYIKIDEIPQEYKELAEFACEVCQQRIKSFNKNKGDCPCKTIGKEYCVDIGRVIKRRLKERENGR